MLAHAPGAIERWGVRAGSAVAGGLPPGLGQSALARAYVSRERWPPGSRRRQRFRGGAVFELDLGDRTQAEAFLLRTYEPELVRYMLETTPRSGVIFDVGANVGMVTFQALAQRPDLRLHAFEPNPGNAAAWLRNRELNPRGAATLKQAAVGATTGSGTLVVPADSGSGFIKPGSGDVEVLTLDEYAAGAGIDRIDLLKLDVEGREFGVLQGATRLIAARAVRRVVCEFNDVHLAREGLTRAGVLEWLREQGYVQRTLPSVGARRLRGVRTDDLAFELDAGAGHRDRTAQGS